MKIFLYSSSVYACHLFLISFASVRSIPVLSFIVPIFAWNVPLVSLIFLKIRLSHSIVFLYFFYVDHRGRLSYLFLLFFGTLHQMGMSFLLASLLFTDICKASSDSHFVFLHFFFGEWSCSLPPVQCHELPFIVLQSLSDLIPWIYSSLPLYNHKGFDLGHNWMVYWFSLLSSISVWIWQ